MMQISLSANNTQTDPSAELRSNYFLPLPLLSHNIFAFIVLDMLALILAVPLIIVNTTFLEPDIQIRAIVIAILTVVFLPLGFGSIRLILYYLRPRLTDEEYDKWVRDHEPGLREQGFLELTLHDDDIIDTPRCIQGIVWPNSEAAQFYRNNGDPMIKWDRRGKPHASINSFVFFYPTQHSVSIFTCDVNALSNAKAATRAQKFLYKDIVGFEVNDLKAAKYLSNTLRQLEIKIKGHSLSIPISPLNPNATDIVKLLNALLREHQNS
jgi:hypothetical protein